MGKTELKLEVDAALLERARRAGIALDSAFESGLKLALSDAAQPQVTLVASAKRKALDPQRGERQAEAWAKDNAEAIASHNRFVEEHGVFGEDFRSW